MKFSLGIVSPGARVIPTWNPADKDADVTLSNANRTATLGSPSGTYNNVRAGSFKTIGKWVFEIIVTTATAELGVGVSNILAPVGNYLGVDGNAVGYYSTTGEVYRSEILISTLPTFVAGDVISCAWDSSSTSVWFAKNGAWNGDPVANSGNAASIPGPITPAGCLEANGSALTISPTLSYTPPSGFQPWI